MSDLTLEEVIAVVEHDFPGYKWALMGRMPIETHPAPYVANLSSPDFYPNPFMMGADGLPIPVRGRLSAGNGDTAAEALAIAMKIMQDEGTDFLNRDEAKGA